MKSLLVPTIGAIVLLSTPVALAQPAPPAAPPPLPANATVVATGLLNPRGFAFAPDGSLVVAEAGLPPAGFTGAGGPPTPTFQPPTALTSRVSKIDAATGQRTTIAEHLPMSAGPFGDTLGAVNVAFLGNDTYVLISAGPVHGWPYYPSGVYKLNPDGTVRLVANIDAFNARTPVALIPPDDELSNPYDMIASDGALWVTDGNRNQILKITPDGTISRVADLSGDHPVTTGMALGADGRFVVTELTAVPFPTGAGRVLSVGIDGSVNALVGGTTAATGAAVGLDGSVYVVEHSTSLGRPPFLAPFTGRVARLGADGQLTTIAGNLMFPTIARLGPDGLLYVADFSVGSTEAGEGRILRIDPNAAP
jgi:hypothetical protein